MLKPFATAVIFCTASSFTPAFASTMDQSMDLITLPPAPVPEIRGSIGWKCDSLLQADFSLHRRGSCGASDTHAALQELSTRSIDDAPWRSKAGSHLSGPELP